MAQPSADTGRNVMLLAGSCHFLTHFFELMFPTLAVTMALMVAIAAFASLSAGAAIRNREAPVGRPA